MKSIHFLNAYDDFPPYSTPFLPSASHTVLKQRVGLGDDGIQERWNHLFLDPYGKSHCKQRGTDVLTGSDTATSRDSYAAVLASLSYYEYGHSYGDFWCL
jgi:hypothetical protein